MKMTDDIIAFISGAFTGGWSSLFLLQTTMHDMVFQFPIKLLSVMFISLCGGIMGLLGKDLYNHKIKKKLFKDEQDKN